MSKYVNVNTELLKKCVKKSGLTQEQFNEDIRLPKCKRMVHNCIARGKLRKDQAYAIIQKYGLDEREFILGEDAEEVHPVLAWLSKLDDKTLNFLFNVKSIEELLMSDVTMSYIAKAYEWHIEQKAFEKKHDDFQKRLCELMDEYDMGTEDVKAHVAGIEDKKRKENNKA